MIKDRKKSLWLLSSILVLCLTMLFASSNFITKATSVSSGISSRFIYSTGICSTTLGVDSEISLPTAKINTDAEDNSTLIDCSLTVLKDGEVMSDYNEVTQYEDSFKFLSEGFYEFIYSSSDSSVSDVEKFCITISSDAPKFVYTESLDYVMDKGTTIFAPNAKFFNGTDELVTSYMIVCPSGVAYDLTKYKLSEVGGYKILISTVYENKHFSFTKEFYVVGVNTNNSSVTASSFGNASFVEELKVLGSYADKTGADKLILPGEGINLTLSGNDYYIHDEVIDLSKIGATQKLFNAYIKPHGDIGVNAEIYVELIDVNDPNNYLSVMFDTAVRYAGNPKGGYWLYLRAAVPSIGQDYVGAFMNYSGAGGKNVLFARLGGGAHGGVDVSGVTPDYYPLSFAYDETTKQVHYFNKGSNDTMLAADMDDETTLFAAKYIPNNAMVTDVVGFYPGCPWKGFSSDKVYMRIRTNSQTALELSITDIAGLSLEPEFKTTHYSDDSFNLVYESNKVNLNNLPIAVVGENYPLPSVNIRDASGTILNTEVEVYNSSNPQLKIANDKKSFVPNTSGEYTVNLIAKDLYGYKKVFTYYVDAIVQSDYEGVTINVEQPSSMTAGVDYFVPAAEIIGGSNRVFVKVTDPNNDEMLYEYVAGLSFKPVRVGKYTVEYSTKDHLGFEYTKTLEIQSIASEKPIIESDVILPRFFIAGQKYTMPEMIAFDYKELGSAKEVKATVKAFVNDAVAGTDITDTEYTIPSNANKIKIVYTATTSIGSEVKEYEIKVKNVVNEQNQLLIEKYFETYNTTVTNTEDGLKVSSSTTNGKVEFIKPLFLSRDGFYIDLTVLSAENFTDSINIYLQDSVDVNNIVKLTLLKGNATDNQLYSNISVNNGKGFLIPGSFFNNTSRFMIEYYNDNFKVASYNNAYEFVSKTMYGEEFNGFTSNYVYLTVEFGNVELNKTASILINRVNNQKLNSTITVDKTAPQIWATSNITSCKVGDVVSTSIATAADVLANNTTVAVKVVDGAKKVVTSVDGIALDKVPADRVYEFVPAKIGNYVITYYAYDDSGNNLSATEKFNCVVMDIEQPVITVSGEVASELKLNKGVAKLVLPKASAKDDDGTILEVKYWIVKPNGVLEIVSGESIMLQTVGKYTLIVSAEDVSGNFDMESFEIFVK